MPLIPQSRAMRLQHSRSAAVISAAGCAQAMIGIANIQSDRIDTPTLLTSFIVRLTVYHYRFRLISIAETDPAAEFDT